MSLAGSRPASNPVRAASIRPLLGGRPSFGLGSERGCSTGVCGSRTISPEAVLARPRGENASAVTSTWPHAGNRIASPTNRIKPTATSGGADEKRRRLGPTAFITPPVVLDGSFFIIIVFSAANAMRRQAEGTVFGSTEISYLPVDRISDTSRNGVRRARYTFSDKL